MTESRQTGTVTYGPYPASVNFTPAYLPLVQIAPAQYFQKVRPGQAFDFPIGVSNLGNGPSRITFSVRTVNQYPATVKAPDALTLASRHELGQPFRSDVHVTGRVPPATGYVNYISSFEVHVDSRTTDARGGATDSSAVTLSMQVQGTGAGGSPGPSFLLSIAALAILVPLIRRR
jgi:hypothetical protein